MEAGEGSAAASGTHGNTASWKRAAVPPAMPPSNPPYPCRTTVPMAFTTSRAAVSAERLPTSASGASSTMS